MSRLSCRSSFYKLYDLGARIGQGNFSEVGLFVGRIFVFKRVSGLHSSVSGKRNKIRRESENIASEIDFLKLLLHFSL